MHSVGAVVLAAIPSADNIHVPTHWDAVGRIALAWALTFALGFERQVRGAMAGDRTFSLLGAATALIGVLAGNGASTILAGAVTGIGFIGGGLCFRQTVQEHEVLHGITTAASIFACSAIGAACGLGLVKESIAATAATLLTLELRHIPLLRTLDARRWQGLVHHDEHVHSHFFKHSTRVPHQGGGNPAEMMVATPDTADTDAVVLVNPIIAARQAAAATAATVAPVVPDVPVVTDALPADGGVAAAPAGKQ
ncbi:MgtC/SapB family protein [Catenulispora pinisilvae]|uniref:MgtC/SapB family protein n=1 Tax=Catenulispora pinisilvae TaxID=2705253 RepID=UPI001891E705|nr:MgtC/SapB family protein [Catenulispora pinisilvae]